MWKRFWAWLTESIHQVNDIIVIPEHAYLMTNVVCPECSGGLSLHCEVPDCLWLRCQKCEYVFGPTNQFIYGKARARREQAQKRQNGV